MRSLVECDRNYHLNDYREGGIIMTKEKVSNYSTDTLIYTADSVGNGVWTITISGNAVGTSKKCSVYYRIVN